MLPLEYIGKQYLSCWDFARHFYRDQFGVELSQTAVQSSDLFAKASGIFLAGDLVMMQESKHCGVYYAGGILHQPSHDTGVIYECAREHLRKSSGVLRLRRGNVAAGSFYSSGIH